MPARITSSQGRKDARSVSYRTGVQKPSSSMESRMFGKAQRAKPKMASNWNSGCKNCGS